MANIKINGSTKHVEPRREVHRDPNNGTFNVCYHFVSYDSDDNALNNTNNNNTKNKNKF